MEENIRFEITSVKQETSEARTYELRPLNSAVNFLPGQFLTIIFHFEHQEIRRSYSIISLPGEPIKITVQRVENGAVSRYILINWKVGTLIESLPPTGRFTLSPQKNVSRDIFLLAAGSGITPILSQLRYLLKEEPQSLIHLFYSNNSEDKTIFRSEIEQIKGSASNFELTEFLSNPKSHWNTRQRLNNGLLEILVNKKMKFNKAEAVFMICGPFTYMRMVKMTLTFMKFREDQIKTENFLPEIMRSGTRTVPDFPDRHVLLELKGQHYDLLVHSGQSILRAALQSNINLPYSCEGGICSVCAAICKKGKVKMAINEVLTDKDIADGWVLTCTGYPAEEGTVIRFE